jgi:maltose alpha-D-glucosyltransferase/alpha-amylase
MYYALREEKAAPIRDVLADTPDIPPGTQWGTFLRNHDELTLEMVSAEERAAMYGWYAPDPRMRANLGVRRRLAPLLDNSRAEFELIHALLLSLPGSPCLYYGDEIGMGDNIWLVDRDAVRTPMQWTPDRNAGFSSADPGKLYLPVVTSLVYHHNNVNVEAHMASGSSHLHWMRAMLRVRGQHPVFGLGAYLDVPCSNDAVLSFLRSMPAGQAPEGKAETVLCLNNLSSRPQAGSLELPGRFADAKVKDLFGGSGFPSVGPDARLTMTLGARDFFWVRLQEPDADA